MIAAEAEVPATVEEAMAEDATTMTIAAEIGEVPVTGVTIAETMMTTDAGRTRGIRTETKTVGS